MTIDEIRERVDQIEAWVSDPEAAHVAEDQLYRDFVRHIAQYFSGQPLGVKAELVLATQELKFPRWTA